MSDFSFTGTVECDRCGNYLSSSDDECDECSDKDLQRYHFEYIGDEDHTEIVWSINRKRAWHDLMEQVDEPIPWKCVETRTTTLSARVNVVDVWNGLNGED